MLVYLKIDYNVLCRFLHEQSEENYFVIHPDHPVGKACETTALLVPSEDPAFKPLVDLLKVHRNEYLPRYTINNTTKF